MVKKTAVILSNLGGPSDQNAVRPFLFNLFNDAAIIRAPQPFRFLIALLISFRRARIAGHIYARMGGGSPILKNTVDQAQALEAFLNSSAAQAPQPMPLYKTFIAMRYWHPFARETAAKVKDFAPDELILLPLYPQFSTTTTQSSLKDWRRFFKADTPTKVICCYPMESGFIRTLAASVRRAYDEAKRYGEPRILFSAHGLPEKIIKAGDPYQAQCEMTVEILRQEIGIEGLDSILCFQSRVGPLRWIGPATDEEVRRAGKDKKPVVIVPISFVSDHSETLVEIDIEYRHLAAQAGASFFASVPAVGAAPEFIEGLARLVTDAQKGSSLCASSAGCRICPNNFSGCPCIAKERMRKCQSRKN